MLVLFSCRKIPWLLKDKKDLGLKDKDSGQTLSIHQSPSQMFVPMGCHIFTLVFLTRHAHVKLMPSWVTHHQSPRPNIGSLHRGFTHTHSKSDLSMMCYYRGTRRRHQGARGICQALHTHSLSCPCTREITGQNRSIRVPRVLKCQANSSWNQCLPWKNKWHKLPSQTSMSKSVCFCFCLSIFTTALAQGALKH